MTLKDDNIYKKIWNDTKDLGNEALNNPVDSFIAYSVINNRLLKKKKKKISKNAMPEVDEEDDSWDGMCKKFDRVRWKIKNDPNYTYADQVYEMMKISDDAELRKIKQKLETARRAENLGHFFDLIFKILFWSGIGFIFLTIAWIIFGFIVDYPVFQIIFEAILFK